MSASLVGSEMCIRDSPPSPERVVLQLLFASSKTTEPRSSGWGLRGGRACLLYTSDAADDM
eukprot:13518939-Alexandrium_andersonii.AAC.1